MLGNVIHKAKELLQSDHEVKLKDLQASYNSISIPQGGARSVCRDKLSILNKTSANRVTNDDSNCFWYALTMLVYVNHKSIATIKKTQTNSNTTNNGTLCPLWFRME